MKNQNLLWIALGLGLVYYWSQNSNYPTLPPSGSTSGSEENESDSVGRVGMPSSRLLIRRNIHNANI